MNTNTNGPVDKSVQLQPIGPGSCSLLFRSCAYFCKYRYNIKDNYKLQFVNSSIVFYFSYYFRILSVSVIILNSHTVLNYHIYKTFYVFKKFKDFLFSVNFKVDMMKLKFKHVFSELFYLMF